MIKNNILTSTLQKLKYAKNTFFIKCRIIKKKKFNGEKVSLKDLLIEFGIIKKNKLVKNGLSSRIIIKDDTEPKKHEPFFSKHKKVLINISSSVGLILVSFLFANIISSQSINMNFIKNTEENEAKILNILKSPKTESYIQPFYNQKTNEVDYTILLVDNLDSYSYRLNLRDISIDLKNQVLQHNQNNTKKIESLDKITPTLIVEYDNKYLINNKYNIDKSLVKENDFKEIEKDIKIQLINKSVKVKNSISTYITIILSIVSNMTYFIIKKVISKK